MVLRGLSLDDYAHDEARLLTRESFRAADLGLPGKRRWPCPSSFPRRRRGISAVQTSNAEPSPTSFQTQDWEKLSPSRPFPRALSIRTLALATLSEISWRPARALKKIEPRIAS